eukprot:XP_001699710.1 FAD-dependent oxidoreductase [Chlamydomonas reinhardtii]
MPATPSVARAAQRYCGCSIGAVLRGRRHGVAPAKSPAAFPPAGSHGISPDATSMTTSTSPGPPGPLHYAVVGAGLAGVAAAWQLLKRTPHGRSVHLHLYDAAGIAAGGSGAAAGLLHPYSPRGKLLWRGREAMDEAMQLVAAAEAAHAFAEGCPPGPEPASSGPFVWRHGLLRPAASAKQSADFAKAAQATVGAGQQAAPVVRATDAGSMAGSSSSSSTRIRVVNAAELEALVPGLSVPGHVAAAAPSLGTAPEAVPEGPVTVPAGPSSTGGNRRARRAAVAAATATVDAASNAGLLIESGLVLDVGRYLRGLWLACQGLTLVMSSPAAGRGGDAAVCGAGSSEYPAGAPSLLGQPYLAAQSRQRLVVGATKAYGWSADQALAACCRSEYAEAHDDRVPAAAGAPAEREAVEALRAAACGVWRPLSDWQLDRVREGVRALPPRTQHGSLPLLGCVSAGRPWWLVAGLGSRGLVYHGWLGRLVAEAALGEALAGPAPSASASFARGLDSAGTGGVGLREVECAGAAAGAGAVVQGMAVEGRGEGEGEAGLPEELTAWRRVAPGAAVFEAP